MDFNGSASAKLTERDEDRLAERTHIAQELHDTLLQGLFAVSLHLQTAVDDLPAECHSKSRFRDISQLLASVVEQGRRSVQGLRSPNQSANLGEAFAVVLKELGFSSSGCFRVVVLGSERELRPEVREQVFSIGREAILNAYRHSRAKHIETEVEYRPTGLRVAVRDNGCGIDPRELQWERKGHWGLRGMRERAERIGARFRVLSGVALGTEVELQVPKQIAFGLRAE